MTVAVANFIEALLVHYPVKHDSEEREDAWVNSMIGALKGYGASVLQEVAQHIIRTRKYRNFPLMSEILDACDKVEKRREFEKRSQIIPDFRPSAGDDWSAERVRLAHELKFTQLGRQAAKEGWIVSFWHFCREHQRVPTAQSEITKCKRDSDGIDELYAKCLRGDAGTCSKVLAEACAGVLAKRQKWTAEVLGRAG